MSQTRKKTEEKVGKKEEIRNGSKWVRRKGRNVEFQRNNCGIYRWKKREAT